ncbi:UNVERIFIED_CONTAM: hypothetical protein K2H54_047082 [Gekko kuhli]
MADATFEEDIFDTIEDEDLLSPVTKCDLLDMEARLFSKMKELWKPMQDQLAEIKTTLSETKTTAETAFSLAGTVQEENKNIQKETDQLNHKMLNLDLEQRNNNIKFRGFPEQLNTTEDLNDFMASWLAQLWKLDEDVVPVIVKAYRIGSPKNPNRKEAITKRRDLKTTTSLLRDHNIKYRWIGAATLQVIYKGERLQATTAEEGLNLLKKLNLKKDDATARNTFKRRLQFNATPPKNNKIPVPNEAKE